MLLRCILWSDLTSYLAPCLAGPCPRHVCTGRRVTIINIAGHTECYCHGDSGTVTCNKMYHWPYWRRIYLASGLVMGFEKGLRGSNPCQINILTTQTPYTMARGEEGGGRAGAVLKQLAATQSKHHPPVCSAAHFHPRKVQVGRMRGGEYRHGARQSHPDTAPPPPLIGNQYSLTYINSLLSLVCHPLRCLQSLNAESRS